MQGKHARVPLLTVILATLTGCATGPSWARFPEGDRPPMAAKETDTAAKEFAIQKGLALVYLYRPGAESGALYVQVDEKGECTLWAGTFFVISLKPGAHKILATDIRTIPPEGGTYYFNEEAFGRASVTVEPGQELLRQGLPSGIAEGERGIGRE